MRTIRCSDQLRSSYPRHLADSLPQPARMSPPRTDSPGAIPDISPPDRSFAEGTVQPPRQTLRNRTTRDNLPQYATEPDNIRSTQGKHTGILNASPANGLRQAPKANIRGGRLRKAPPPSSPDRSATAYIVSSPPGRPRNRTTYDAPPHDIRRTHGRRLRDSPQRNAPPTVYIRQAQRTIRPAEQLTENLPNLSAESAKRTIRATRQPRRRTVFPRYTSPRPLRKTPLPGGGKTKRRRAPCYGHPSRSFSRRKTYFRIGGRNFPAGHELLGGVSADCRHSCRQPRPAPSGGRHPGVPESQILGLRVTA